MGDRYYTYYDGMAILDMDKYRTSIKKEHASPILNSNNLKTIKLKSYAQTSVAITLPKNRYEKMGRPQVGQKLQVDLKII